ncbi:MAG: hypothetical protein ABR562_07880 [Thermoplasmatota archaeon]
MSILLVPTGTAASAGHDKASADLDGTFSYLAALVQRDHDQDEMAPYLVEAAVASGKDPATWPPAASALSLLPGADDMQPGLIHFLRPAHALAVAGRLGPESNETATILAAFAGGQFGATSLLNDDIWVLLTLPRAGIPRDDARVQADAGFLLAHQGADGGWSWATDGPSETDETGMALEALAGVGRLGADVAERALAFVARQTSPDGGVALVKPGAANCDSTAWSIRASAAAGRPPPPQAWAFLASLRNADGTYQFTRGGNSNVICTIEAATVLGMALREGWDLSGYPGGKTAAGGGLPALAALAGATVRRRSGRRIGPSMSGIVLKTLRGKTRVAHLCQRWWHGWARAG